MSEFTISPREIARACRECARPLDDPGTRVRVKRFCSAECRSRFHARERQRAWERYRAEGLGKQAEASLAASIIDREEGE